jgi:hypothetical protein
MRRHLPPPLFEPRASRRRRRFTPVFAAELSLCSLCRLMIFDFHFIFFFRFFHLSPISYFFGFLPLQASASDADASC